MREHGNLIQACESELSDNLLYLRHPVNTAIAIMEDICRDFQSDAGQGLIDVAELVLGSLLFATVVVPLGVVGKVTGTGKWSLKV